jgi:hypothetical protein
MVGRLFPLNLGGLPAVCGPGRSMSDPNRSTNWLGRTVLLVWAPLAFVAVGTLAVGHWWTLPKPEAKDPLVQAAIRDQWQQSSRRWVGVHILYSMCKCSERIVRHLAERRPLPDVTEAVVLVGSNDELERAIRDTGYELEVVTPEQLSEKYHIQSAPMFAVMDPNGALRYVGGYTERKQGLMIQDVTIVERLRSERPVMELPLFGCAVSRSLQALLDPLGIKYRSQEDPRDLARESTGPR